MIQAASDRCDGAASRLERIAHALRRCRRIIHRNHRWDFGVWQPQVAVEVPLLSDVLQVCSHYTYVQLTRSGGGESIGAERLDWVVGILAGEQPGDDLAR